METELSLACQLLPLVRILVGLMGVGVVISFLYELVLVVKIARSFDADKETNSLVICAIIAIVLTASILGLTGTEAFKGDNCPKTDDGFMSLP